MVKNAFRQGLLWVLALTLAMAAALLSADFWYQKTLSNAQAFAFPPCHRVWGHRGYAEFVQENSLASVQSAFDNGASGVEFDILYDRTTNDFVVSHDKPYALHDGKPLKLEDLLAKFHANGFFWLDAKDLRTLSPWVAYRATQRLAAIIHRFGLKNRTFVESGNPLYLKWLADQGVFTSFMVGPNDKKYGPLAFAFATSLMKLGYAFIGGGAISMNDYRYTAKTRLTFGEVPILLSTVNRRESIERLLVFPAVKVVLTDKNFFTLNTCSGHHAP